ncbi:hypothetical protein [Teichococcus vastitatis]|uniref:5-bromo-4-chloroindolyl phosphate hydrolysis protein n=1 Tax=Teichococcus vastitatis TaxID=2307076 RepID=A0ABS9WBK1_9PROT|nr:hypothetical protein [Pseudoroseomonas vastitatis]MCI0756678.1 hypothetical protein [Pseudoroseomonas vastitatis]
MLRDFLANFRVLGKYRAPVDITIGLALSAVAIPVFADRTNWANYLSAHATASAAIIAVMIAVWLEWKKDQAAQVEQAIRSRVHSSRLLPIAKGLEEVLAKTAIDVKSITRQNGPGAVGIQSRKAMDKHHRQLREEAGSFHLLTDTAGRFAAELLGKYATYEELSERANTLIRTPNYQWSAEMTLKTIVSAELDIMHGLAKELHRTLNEELARKVS